MSVYIPKVLMLHGFSQNASIFSKRVAALRKSFGKDIELVFVDAPIVLHPVDIVGSLPTQTSPGSLAAFGAPEATAAAEDPALIPRGWWRANDAKTVMVGLEESLEYLKGILREQRFDGVFGFSQGAAMAALLSALLEHPQVFPQILVNGEAPHPPFKFCVAVSGFKPAGDVSATIFAGGYRTPTLHVIGKNDILVVEERSQQLVDVSENARVEEHDGGHFVPSKASWRTFFKSYLLDPIGDTPSPGISSSTPASGTATPTTTGDKKYSSL